MENDGIAWVPERTDGDSSANEGAFADQNLSTDYFDPNRQRHHTDNRLVRTRYPHVLAELDDERVARLMEHVAEAFGLPHDLPVPPSGFPGFWSKPISAKAMALIRDGALATCWQPRAVKSARCG